MAQTAVVVVAAGASARMGAPKAFLVLGDRPVLAHALSPFLTHPQVVEVVVVLAAGAEARFRDEVLPRLPTASLGVTTGGPTRQASVRAGLAALRSAAACVLVHDGARPFVSKALIDRVLEAAQTHGGAVPALPPVDSLKRVDAQGFVREAVSRAGLVRVQTPQGFRREVLVRALEAAARAGEVFGDEAGAVTRYGGVPVRAVPGEPFNLKLTTPADLKLAAGLLRAGVL